ncbi:hypothetical protein NL108_013781 [Boleophthalmus pectinirostris]|nr:hypothetical protein NL108_013781 [Boleophthalmus pectinirostris]
METSEDPRDLSPDQSPDPKPDQRPDLKPDQSPDQSPDPKPDQSPDLKPQEAHNEKMNGLSNPEEKLTNGESEEPMETEPEPETKPESRPESRPETRPETRPESRPESRPETGDLSSINEMMSAVMSSGVMSSSTINGEGEEPCESAASANSAGPSPSPSPTKTLTSAMRAPPSRNQRRTQDSRDDSAFVCPLCDKNCQTQHQLTMHIRQHNADTGASDHSCSICGKCLSSASSLDRHMLVHSGERPYKCSVCGQTFTTNGNMHRHMKIHEKDPASGLVLLSPPSPSPTKRRRPSVKRRGGDEGDEPPSKKTVEEACVEDSSVTPTKTVEEELPCPICFKVLTSRLELDAHMDTHPDTTLRCDMCCLTFRTHRGLLRHNAAVHKLLPLDPSGRPFIQNNPSIPAGFNELAFIDFSCAKFSLIAQVWCETNLRRCISKFHRFVCESCDRAFPLSSALDLHDCSAHKPAGVQSGAQDLKDPAHKPAGVQSGAGELKTPSKNHQENQDQTTDQDQDQDQDRDQDQDPEQSRDQGQEGFLEALGLKLTSKIPVGPSEAELVQARLDSIKTIPVDPSSVHTEALSLGLALGVPLFQTGFLLQSEGGATGSEAPPLVDLAGLQHILQVAAATPNQIALSLKGGATGVSSQKPPLKPRPPPAPRCGLASTPPPPAPASLGCISPSLPPPAPLFNPPPPPCPPRSPLLPPSQYFPLPGRLGEP